MARSLLIFATVLAFASVLVSSACVNKEGLAGKGVRRIVIDDFTPVLRDDLPGGGQPRAFIGDLEIGRRRAGEQLIEAVGTIPNESNNVETVVIQFNVPGISHYLRAVSEGNAKAAICSFEDTLGSNKGYFSVRTVPNSSTNIRVFIGVH